MLFQIDSMWQLLGWVLVFAGLVISNEIQRRTKAGGIMFFGVILAILTVYFVAIQIGVKTGASWAMNSQTYEYMNGWFHYAKLYAAVAGCIGFMLLKYKKGVGATQWFKAFPFVIVAINILIAVGSDFESAIKGAEAVNGWWFSNEKVWLNGGWWNWVNGIAGILNIFCMTGWWGIYSSKDKNHQDMLWPDMTVWFIVAYDLWNFTYTYNNLPTHSWYCGLALLLAPTFANALWNKGGWIQNRANTLATWCMFAQVFPLFQIGERFSVLPVLYENTGATYALELCDYTAEQMAGIAPNTTVQGVAAILALVVNVICISVIIKRSIEQKKNPYKNEIWVGTKDYVEAMNRAE
ncbi:MAG: DUF5692 family protein [Acetatifactor sp.]